MSNLPDTGPSCRSICQYVMAEVLGDMVLGMDWFIGRRRMWTIWFKRKKSSFVTVKITLVKYINKKIVFI